MPMDYFRRPLLSGGNLTHLTYATVHGNLRRSDADGISTVPYFPAVVIASTLSVKIQATTFNVLITGNSLTTVLADINAAIGASGTALDTDGSISIRTSVVGSTGSVEILPCTAAASLGFDVSRTRLRSTGGDILSSPEGRLGNALGVSFPNRGENLSSESVNRAFARVSANSDILYSDAARGDAKMRKVAFTTSGDGKFVALNPTTSRVFTGLGLLSNASVEEDLAPYFTVIDSATKQLAVSRVVGVVKGSPAGLPPYANAGSYAGPGNVLGQDLVKATATIDAVGGITNGRVVSCTGTNFVTAGVQAGDFASITGASNLTPWNNNGYRWVVEEVLSTSTIALRPMSKAEMVQVGIAPQEEQPILELNSQKSVGQAYGTVTVKTGTFCEGVNLVLDPPIQTGATYEIWAAVAVDDRSTSVYDMREGMKGVFSGNVNDLPVSPDYVITRPTVELLGADVVVSSFFYRKGDKILNIPGRTFTPVEVIDATPVFNYIYLDLVDYRLKINYSPVIALGLDPGSYAASLNGWDLDTQGQQNSLIATVQNTAGVLHDLVPATRIYAAAESRVITVGSDSDSGFEGQFQTLEEALHYISTHNQYGILGAADKVTEIVVYGYQQITRGITASIPGHLRIRGAHGKDVTSLGVQAISETCVFDLSVSTLSFENIGIDNGSTGKSLVKLSSLVRSVDFIDVNVSQNPFLNLIQTTGSGSLINATFLRSNLLVSKGVMAAAPVTSSAAVTLDDCTITGVLTEVSPQLFCAQAGPGTGNFGFHLTLHRCIFTDFKHTTATPTTALLVNGLSVNKTLVVSDCSFNSAGSPGNTGGSSLLIRWDGPALVRNNTGNLPTNLFFHNGGSSAISILERNNVSMRINGPLNGVQATSVKNNVFSGVDSDAGFSSGFLVQATEFVENSCSGVYQYITAVLAMGNTVSVTPSVNSPYFRGLSARTAISNIVTLNVGANSSCSGIDVSNGGVASGNFITVTGSGTPNASACAAITVSGSLSSGTIRDNVIEVTNVWAIYAVSSAKLTISGNRIKTSSVVTDAICKLGHFDGASTAYYSVTDNWISGNGSTGPVAFDVKCDVSPFSNVEAHFHNNIFDNLNTSQGPIIGRGVAYVEGNKFSSAVNMNSNLTTGLRLKSFCDNIVEGGTASSFTVNDVIVAIEGNKFYGAVTLTLSSGSDRMDFHGNDLESSLTLAGSGVVLANSNRVTGACSVSTNMFVEMTGNHFSSSVAISNGNFSNNRVEGPFQTDIGAVFPLKVLVDGNTFSGSSTLIQSPGTGGTQMFLNNYCIGVFSVSNASDFPGISIENCMFQSSLTLVSIDSFNGCKVGHSNPASLLAVSLTGSSRAINVSGLATQDCSVVMTKCNLVGSHLKSTSFTSNWTFTNCSVSGCFLQTPTVGPNIVTFGTSKISASHILMQVAGDDLNIDNSDLSSVKFVLNGADLVITNSHMAGCQTQGATTSTYDNINCSACLYFDASMTVTSTAYFADCNFPDLTLTMSGAGTVVMNGSQFSSLALTAPAGSFVDLSHSHFIGASVFTGGGANLLMNGCMFNSNLTVSAGVAELSNLRIIGSFIWTNDTGYLAMSTSYISENFTTPVATNDSADNITLDACYIGKVATISAASYLRINGCHIGLDMGVLTTDQNFRSGFSSWVTNCTVYSGQAAGAGGVAGRVIFKGNNLVSGQISGNLLGNTRIEDEASNLIISNNRFGGGASGTTTYIPLSIRRCSGPLSNSLHIEGNSFSSINGFIAGTTVQAPCIQIGDSSADIFRNIQISGNQLQMTSRTSVGAVLSMGVINVVGSMREGLITGNQIVRGIDGGSLVNVGVLLTAASNQNIVFDGNHSYSYSGGAIAYSADPKAQGADEYWAGGGTQLT